MIRLAAALLAIAATAAPAAADKPEKSGRLFGGFETTLLGGDLPLFGVRAGYQVADALSLDLVAQSILVVNTVELGARVYVLNDGPGPFLAARVGYLYAIGFGDDVENSFALAAPGVGAEVSISSRWSALLEIGATVGLTGDRDTLLRINAALLRR